MRLKLSVFSRLHTEAVTGVDWLGPEEAVSASDDHQLLRLSVKGAGDGIDGKSKSTLVQLKETLFPTSLHVLTRASAEGATPAELIATSFTNGQVNLLNSSGKMEKKGIDAHKGAVLVVRWANDGSGLLTGGEDGAVKMWSKNGMLRFVLAQNPHPVYAADWNPEDSKICYCSGEDGFIKMLKAQTSPIRWKAHNGICLCMRWSSVHDLIVSGGEDNRYRLWDGYGRPLYSSSNHGYPINSVAWSPSGELFAVGSQNLLRLCDRAGWSHTLEKPGTGSLYSIAWSTDGTQLVAGCADGKIVHAHLVEKRMVWENLEVVQSKQRVVDVRDVLTEVGREKLETRDRVHKLQLSYDHLVVATTKQIYIFSAKNWNTPLIVDLAEGGPQAVSIIKLCERFFLIVDPTAVLKLYSYEGKLQSTIRLPGTTRGEQITERTIGLASDLVAVVDQSATTGRTTICLFDTQNGRETGDGRIVHPVEISELAVNQCGSMPERRVAYVDTNAECFLAYVNSYGASTRLARLGIMVRDLNFNNATNMLSAFQNSILTVWVYPQCAFTDKDLLPQTVVELGTATEIAGSSASIIAFIGNTITVRRSDGSLATLYISPLFAGLTRLTSCSKWDQALRLCHSTGENPQMWACLSSMASEKKSLDIAEACYGQLHEVEKVAILREIRLENDPQMKSALMSLFNKGVREADMALGQHPQLSYRAIMLNIMAFRFERALEIALKYNPSHLDTVVGYRQRYLERTGRKENDSRFLKCLSQVEIDWQHIREKMEAEANENGAT